MHENGIFLRDSRLVRFYAEIEPFVLSSRINGDKEKLQDSEKAVGKLHKNEVIGKKEYRYLPEAAQNLKRDLRGGYYILPAVGFDEYFYIIVQKGYFLWI